FCLSYLLTRRAPRSSLFPYTTLFRSVMVCYDLLEYGGRDIRNEPLTLRRARLTTSIAAPSLRQILLLSEEMRFQDWRDAASFRIDRKSTRLNSSHVKISYAVFCLKKK